MTAILNTPTRASEWRAELARHVARPVEAPFGAYAFAPGDPGAELARVLEAEVFDQAFGNTPAVLASEYGPYTDTSAYLLILDHARLSAAAMVRLILPSADGPGLKSLNDLVPTWCDDPRQLLDPLPDALLSPSTLDWATLAIDPAYRDAGGTGLVSLGLYQTVYAVASVLGAQHLVALLDRAVYAMSRLRYVQPFVPYGATKPYLGSRGSLPVYLPLGEWTERLRLVDPDLRAVIVERRGIEPALDPVPLASVEAVLAKLGAQTARA